MSNKCINIAISGLSLSVSDDLKNKIRQVIPTDYGINWSNLSEPKIDILLINEAFFETPNIQQLINKYHFAILKVSKEKYTSGTIENDILYLPLENESSLKRWLDESFLSRLSNPLANHKDTLVQQLDLNFIREMFDPENGRLHLFDEKGTLAVVDTRTEQVWIEPTRLTQSTNHTFNYDLAKTSDFVKVSRKRSYDLQNWMWNLFFKSPVFMQFSPDQGYFKLHYWPQPINNNQQKNILRMSACFIQGAEISVVAKRLNINENIVRQFVAASIATNMIEQINASASHYAADEKPANDEEQGVIHKFFSKLRRRFGL